MTHPLNHSLPHLYSEAGRGSGIPKGDESVIGRDAHLANDFTNGNDFEGGGAALNTVARPSHFLENASSNTLGLVASDQRRKGESQ